MPLLPGFVFPSIPEKLGHVIPQALPPNAPYVASMVYVPVLLHALLLHDLVILQEGAEELIPVSASSEKDLIRGIKFRRIVHGRQVDIVVGENIPQETGE